MLKRTVLAAGALALATTAAPAAEPARVLSYSGVFQDNYTDVVVKPFNATANAGGVEYVGGESSASMLGQLRTQKTDPQLDVVIMDTTTAAIACAEGLTEKLTPETSPTMGPVLAELDPQARQAGGGCAPGVTFDHYVIVYDSQAVTPAPISLMAMMDPRWRGKLGISAPPDIQGLALTAILANKASGDWKDAGQAFATLKELAPSVQTFTPQPDGYTLVLNGTLAFASGWNARGQLYHDRSNGRLGVMLPAEGTVFQINTINLVRGAPHRDAAAAFIAYALGQAAQKAFTERMFYAPTNSRAQIAPTAAERTAAAPQYKSRIIPVDWSEMVKLREPWNQRWRREVIPASGR